MASVAVTRVTRRGIDVAGPAAAPGPRTTTREQEQPMRLGFVGAGRMGRPMVDRLVRAGHEVRVLGRTAEARAALAAAGAHPVADVAAVGEDADAVLVCVFDDAQVRDVCVDGPLTDRMPRGSVVVVHTTGDPDTAAAVAERAAARGVRVVDAPVSGGPHDVAAGRISLFAGGADDAVARARPVLRCYGDPVLHVGALGAGQRVKLLNNALFAAQIGLLAEAVRLGAAFGLDEPVLLEAFGHGSAASRAQAGVASRGSVARFAAAVGGFLGKDMDVVRRVSAEHGADLGALGEGLDALAGALDAAGERTTTSTAG
ncbi:NAD(P)-dependent oxidoreductase [Actinomadura algeriensis]|uniref:3-hydroxyisobutyrate dehydrogenase-like beta-hydroxyacid dehydrogenase n=1 Tax=Actinomadura algeriensis TaxID=1679523 RepID=A0ABR9JY33_9ACTN|nr:NAD(P)-dependent oxidoreductase [Actinomadura algeriensis]MBE1535487.1 3-hydroxyisobutyrate dehydrogenase-like beta-hydroxyacid dehydrogenase [Actinomadura algeriensis]